MATQRSDAGIHWRTPTVMLLSLVAAIALAAGHHFFYAALENSEVDTRSMKIAGLTTTLQQINTSAGTAFAFFVKSFLVLATSTAYFQMIFGLIHRGAFKISMFDDWFSGPSNLISLANSSSYWRYPLLPLVAVTVWLLPICAIVTPAALTVTFGEVRPWRVESHHVSLPAFQSLAFNALYEGSKSLDSNSAGFRLGQGGPDQEVVRIARAVAFTGNILSAPPPGLNTSWTTDLIAPSLTCEIMNSTYREALKLNIRDVLDVAANDTSVFTCGTGNITYGCPVWNKIPLMFSYLAWLGAELPFFWPNRSSSVASMTSSSQFMSGGGLGIDDNTLGVAVFPRAKHKNDVRWETQENPWTNNTLIDKMFDDATLLKCKVKSSKYTLRFAYEGVAQTQSVQVISETEVRKSVDPCFVGGSAFYLNSSDAGLKVEAFNCKGGFVGLTEWTTPFVKWNLMEWSRDAVLTAFASLITGANNAVTGAPGSAEIYGSNTNYMETQIFSTVLSDTLEIAQISGRNFTLNTTYANSSSDYAYGQALSLTRPINSTTPRMNLSHALEELFFNTTLSFAASEKLRYNTSSPLAPPPVDVTFKTYGNIYAYDSSKLWLTYGLAIGVTILNVIFGLASMFHTGASFTADFSSIIRIAKNASIDVNMTEPNLPGKDPCPKDVAEAQLVVDSRYGDTSGMDRVRDLGSISTSYKPVEQTVREVESEQESLRGR